MVLYYILKNWAEEDYMLAIGSDVSLNFIYFISFFVIFAGISMIKAFIHEVVWEYGLYHFRKKYFIVYVVYYLLFMMINLIFNPQFLTFYYYLLLVIFCFVDLFIFWMIDYRHMYDWKRFLFFSIGSFSAYVLVVELGVLFISISTYFAMGY